MTALAPLAESGRVRQVLRLVEAHLEASESRYAEAASLVEAVATEEATEGDPESGISEALYDLAAVFTERAGGEAEGRGAGAALLARTDATAKGAEPGEVRETLTVYPNPATASGTRPHPRTPLPEPRTRPRNPEPEKPNPNHTN